MIRRMNGHMLDQSYVVAGRINTSCTRSRRHTPVHHLIAVHHHMMVAASPAARVGFHAEWASTVVTRRHRAHDAPDVVRIEELDRRYGPCEDAGERVHGVAIPVDRAQQPLHLGRRGFERGQLRGELVDRQHVSVPRPVVAGHGILEREPAGPRLVQRRGAQRGVTKGVADPLGG